MARIETTHPVDLYVGAGLLLLAALTVVLEAPLGLQVVGGALLTLTLPGYALAAALFPRTAPLTRFRRVGRRGRSDGPLPRGLHPLERAVVAAVLSLIVTPTVGFSLHFTGPGVTRFTLLASLAGFTLAAGAWGAWSRFAAPPHERPRFVLRTPAWRVPSSGPELVMQSLVALSLVVLLAVFLFFPPSLGSDRPYSSFQLLAVGQDVDCYPKVFENGTYRLADGAQATCPDDLGNLTLGVANHEGEAHAYSIYVFWSQNGTQGGDPEAATAYAPMDLYRLELPDAPDPDPANLTLDAQYERGYTLPPPPFLGLQRLHFQLRLDPEGLPTGEPADYELVLFIERR